MAQFFINRPVFAWVVSILIMVLGGLAITKLPVAQYPNVAPPSISVTANYAGASAETMQETVTSVIEQQLNGIDNLLYMSSASDASGLATVTLYFLPGTNPDTAQVQVQNKVQLATPSLPQTVQQQGVVVAKATRNFMMFFTLSMKSRWETTSPPAFSIRFGASRASAKRTCSAPNTRCASGSIPTS